MDITYSRPWTRKCVAAAREEAPITAAAWGARFRSKFQIVCHGRAGKLVANTSRSRSAAKSVSQERWLNPKPEIRERFGVVRGDLLVRFREKTVFYDPILIVAPTQKRSPTLPAMLLLPFAFLSLAASSMAFAPSPSNIQHSTAFATRLHLFGGLDKAFEESGPLGKGITVGKIQVLCKNHCSDYLYQGHVALII